jgi:cobalamin-dependent methionine synthase I
LHDIGNDLVSMMLERAGFEITDLGVGGYAPDAGSANKLAKELVA